MRIGVTGLARAGKTALLTSLAANLQAGPGALPALAERLRGRAWSVRTAPAGADPVPRFDVAAHVRALASDPPAWPARTDAVCLLALDVDIARPGLAGALPPRQLRLELLDYPGEWLVDLPMLGQSFEQWSAATLARLAREASARPFLTFVAALPAGCGPDEAIAAEGTALYRAAIEAARAAGLSMLQPGRMLMAAPGPEPPWVALFPHTGSGGLHGLLARRYEAYQAAVRRELSEPGLGRLDRLIVLADLLGALSAGPAAFADAAAALGAVGRALRAARTPAWFAWLAPFIPALGGIERTAFVASKADHVADRQRGNLARLMGAVCGADPDDGTFAIAAIRCTEDVVWTLDGHPVSAVRGRVMGEGKMGRSYPGEVPDTPPGPEFWAHPFLALPVFEPARIGAGAHAPVPQIGLDRLLLWLIGDKL